MGSRACTAHYLGTLTEQDYALYFLARQHCEFCFADGKPQAGLSVQMLLYAVLLDRLGSLLVALLDFWSG